MHTKPLTIAVDAHDHRPATMKVNPDILSIQRGLPSSEEETVCGAPSLDRDLGTFTRSGDTPPPLSVKSGGGGLRFDVVRPRGRLVVVRACGEASVENPDPTVRDLPDRGVMSLASSTERVVVRACAVRRV
jgi:hypothetical protein